MFKVDLLYFLDVSKAQTRFSIISKIVDSTFKKQFWTAGKDPGMADMPFW